MDVPTPGRFYACGGACTSNDAVDSDMGVSGTVLYGDIG